MLTLLYEPYIITFIITILITILYYVYKKNGVNEDKKDEKQKKKGSFHLETHCILVFISFYSILTSLYYIIKNYISPYQNIEVGELLKENITDKISESIELLKENVIPTFTESTETDIVETEMGIENREIDDIDRNIHDKMMYVGGKKKSYQKDRMKHIYSSKAKIVDNDVDTNPNSFDF